MNNNYNFIRIQQYLNGELGREEMYQLEREALDDPLLHDAIEGYRLHREVSHGRLSLLQQRLADRIANKARERDAYYFGWQRLAVATTACVLMVLVLVLLWMRYHPLKPAPVEKEVEVELTVPEGMSGIQAKAVSDLGWDAQPAAGWESFNAYLIEHNRYLLPVSEDVVLTFDIGANGKPTAIQAEGEADAQWLAEIHRLLDEGPIWNGTRGKIVIVAE